jgi:hypothetical protein
MPSTKLQTNPNIQIRNVKRKAWLLGIGAWNLFGDWDLGFGILK